MPGDTVPHMRQQRIQIEGSRVFVEGREYFLGRASGDDNNCLIDTLRQALGLIVSVGNVRTALQYEFYRAGPARAVLQGEREPTSKPHSCVVST